MTDRTGLAGRNALIATDPASAVAGDFTAICILLHAGTWHPVTNLPVVEVVHLERGQGQPHKAIIERVQVLADRLEHTWHTAPPAIIFDANGIGRPIAERAREVFPANPVFGFVATGSEDGRSDRYDPRTRIFYASKIGHLAALDAASQAGRLLIPKDLKHGATLQAEAQSLRATLSRAGRVIVSEPDSQIAQFDDILSAVSMGVAVADQLWTRERVARLRDTWPDRTIAAEQNAL